MNKKILVMILSLLLVIGLVPGAAFADDSKTSSNSDTSQSFTFILIESGSGFGETPDFTSCRATLQKVKLNGKDVSCDVYNIDGYNYFKLRDIAQMMKGLDTEFAVTTGENYSITVDRNGTYQSVGGELEKTEDKSSTCVKSKWTLEMDGYIFPVYCYNIGGNNYFQLRALGTLIGFDVDYDASENAATITAK